MPRFILAVLALIALLVAILIVAPGLVPVGAYRARLETTASEALGRRVTFGDDLRLKIIPQTAFRVSDLEIANAEGFAAPYLARVKSAEIGVKLIPLFSGEIEVDHFVLTEPDINLARARDGSVNWNLASGEAAEPDAQAGAARELKDLSLGDVRIINGKAAFADAAAGKTYTASDIDLGARLKSLAEPLEVKGTLIFEGAASRIDLVLTSLAAVMRQEDANLKLDVALGEAAAGADLILKTGEAFSYSGPAKLNAPDLRAFAALLGSPIAPSPGFDRLSVDGVAAGDANGVNLSSATIKFDAIDATGDLALNWTGARPKATGRLNAGSLDLRPYLPPPAESAQGFPAWSEEKLDFSSLKNLDADIDLTADKIFLNDMAFGESRMQIVIDNGRMTADIPELGLYGGGGSGRLVINARPAAPTIEGEFDVASVDAQPFSFDVLKNDRLLGLGGLKLDFTASGASQAAIMRSLDGSGGFDLADGAIKGVNLVKLANAISEIQQGGLNPNAIASAINVAQRADEQTDFSEFLSQFTIAKGLVSAPTISLTGPFLTMSGTGAVNLPAQTLDLRLSPRATSTIDGEGGKAYTLPMRVTGTFSQPKIVIDIEALLRGRAEQSVRSILDGLGKKGDGETSGDALREDAAMRVLDGVLGGAKQPKSGATGSGDAPAGADGETAPPPLKETVAKEAINQLFGKKKPPAEPAPAEAPKDEDPQ